MPISIGLMKNICKPLGLSVWLVLFMLPAPVQAAAEVRRSMSLEDKVAQLEKQLQTANRMRAETQFEITNLQNEIRNLRGIIEEQSYQIEQITNRQRDIYRNLDQVAANASQTPANPEQSLTTTAPSTPASGGTSDVVPTQPEVVSDSANTESDIRAKYDAIFPLVRAKQFDDAIVRYQQFIAEYGDSPLVSNARYWLAQIYAVQGRTDEAEREYLLVAQQYPDSDKASDSWLKLGRLYEDRGQTERAIQAYEQLMSQYGSSNAARFAQSRLDVIRP
jgi:tol-pal system protein YbgF